jgi:hypothetical protein
MKRDNVTITIAALISLAVATGILGFVIRYTHQQEAKHLEQERERIANDLAQEKAEEERELQLKKSAVIEKLKWDKAFMWKAASEEDRTNFCQYLAGIATNSEGKISLGLYCGQYRGQYRGDSEPIGESFTYAVKDGDIRLCYSNYLVSVGFNGNGYFDIGKHLDDYQGLLLNYSNYIATNNISSISWKTFYDTFNSAVASADQGELMNYISGTDLHTAWPKLFSVKIERLLGNSSPKNFQRVKEILE